jgi:hypothetical protein
MKEGERGWYVVVGKERGGLEEEEEEEEVVVGEVFVEVVVMLMVPSTTRGSAEATGMNVKENVRASSSSNSALFLKRLAAKQQRRFDQPGVCAFFFGTTLWDTKS